MAAPRKRGPSKVVQLILAWVLSVCNLARSCWPLAQQPALLRRLDSSPQETSGPSLGVAAGFMPAVIHLTRRRRRSHPGRYHREVHLGLDPLGGQMS